ncbi:MAG: hypothetical protein M1821_009769 [Bathelium mastoideum]|nr:MAG: hypothetical protein M1821_009769 [Bathelium mastoideum]KAI9690472.1 MAG: hypothetical protein M1822_009435 [Bathelium mastoideum]
MASTSDLQGRSDSDINAAERGDAGVPRDTEQAETTPTLSGGQTHAVPQGTNAMAITPRSRWQKAFVAIKASNTFFEQLDEWKREDPLLGYPSFAAFLGDDERWMMFRRFSSVQARLILEKQDDMRILEEKLHEMDADDLAKESSDGDKPRRRLFRRYRADKEEAEARENLLRELENKYLEYERLLSAAHRLNTLPRPATYEWKSVVNYVREAKPVIEKESDYIHNQRDLVSVRGASEHAHLGALIERFFNQVKNWKSRKPEEQKSRSAAPGSAAGKKKLPKVKTERKEMDGGSPEKQRFSMREWMKGNSTAEKYARAFIGMMMLIPMPIFFVVPIYALNRIGNNIGKSIGVLLAFGLTFTVVLLTATPARHHEVLGGTATYLAVLVVFFGSLGKGG